MGKATHKVVRTGANEHWTVYFDDGRPLAVSRTEIVWTFSEQALSSRMSDRIRQVIALARNE